MNIEDLGFKICKVCGETKSLNEYHRKPSGRDGRATNCAPCTNKRRRENKDNEIRTDVTIRVSHKLRDALNREAHELGVPTSWLSNRLLAYALAQLIHGKIEIPDDAPRARHRDAPNGSNVA